MPVYDVEDPKTGTKLTLEGDKPPTGDQLRNIFGKVYQKQREKTVRYAAQEPVSLTGQVMGMLEAGAIPSEMGQLQAEHHRNKQKILSQVRQRQAADLVPDYPMPEAWTDAMVGISLTAAARAAQAYETVKEELPGEIAKWADIPGRVGAAAFGLPRPEPRTAEDVRQFAKWYQEPFKPIPRPEFLQPHKDDNFAEGMAKDLANQLLSIPEFIESPLGLTTLGAGGVSKAAGAVIRYAFAADMLKSLFEQSPELVDNWDKMSWGERGQHIGRMLGTAYMAKTLMHPEFAGQVRSEWKEVDLKTLFKEQPELRDRWASMSEMERQQYTRRFDPAAAQAPERLQLWKGGPTLSLWPKGLPSEAAAIGAGGAQVFDKPFVPGQPDPNVRILAPLTAEAAHPILNREMERARPKGAPAPRPEPEPPIERATLMEGIEARKKMSLWAEHGAVEPKEPKPKAQEPLSELERAEFEDLRLRYLRGAPISAESHARLKELQERADNDTARRVFTKAFQEGREVNAESARELGFTLPPGYIEYEDFFGGKWWRKAEKGETDAGTVKSTVEVARGESTGPAEKVAGEGAEKLEAAPGEKKEEVVPPEGAAISDHIKEMLHDKYDPDTARRVDGTIIVREKPEHGGRWVEMGLGAVTGSTPKTVEGTPWEPPKKPEAKPAEPAKKETVTAATFTHPETGEISTAESHPEAAQKLGVTAPEAHEDRLGPEYGFEVTDEEGNKRIVTREEAHKIAKASGQLIDESRPPEATGSDQIKFPEAPKKPVVPGVSEGAKERIKEIERELSQLQRLATRQIGEEGRKAIEEDIAKLEAELKQLRPAEPEEKPKEPEKPKVEEKKKVETKPKEPEKKAEPPKPRPSQAPVVQFLSGTEKSVGDIDRAIAEGRPVGVTTGTLTTTVRQKLVNYLKAGGTVFMDNGAFAAFLKGKPIEDFSRVLASYQEIADQVEEADEGGKLFVVAPDVIGDAAKTREAQSKYAAEINDLHNSGAYIIFPVHKAEGLSLANAVGQAVPANPRPDFRGGPVIGIPFNKAAWSKADVIGWLEAEYERKYSRFPDAPPVLVHLLGGSKADVEWMRGEAERLGVPIEHSSGDTTYDPVIQVRKHGTPEQRHKLAQADVKAAEDAVEAANKAGDEKQVRASLEALDKARAKLAKAEAVLQKETQKKAPKTETPPPKPEPPAKTATTGGEFSASTPVHGNMVKGNYELVEQGDLVTSFDKGYDPALQPRDRTRIASANQIATIVQRFEPQRMGAAATTDMGAPVIDERNQVLSGNARTTALRTIYGSEGEGGAAYKHWLTHNAAEFGLTPEAVAGMKEPVLVRRVSDYGKLDKIEFARQSNQQQVLGMGEAEKAASDARMLATNPGLLDAFRPGEDGNILAASNREFLNKFIQGTGDQAELLTKQGYNGPALIKRVKNAILGTLLGPENQQLMNQLIEGAEEYNLKNVVNGTMALAPSLVRFKGTAYDISAHLTQALKDLVGLRTRGEKLSEFFDNNDLFGDPNRTGESDLLLEHLYEAKSVKAITEALQAYAKAASEALLDAQSGGMFGDVAATREQILERIYGQAEVKRTPTSKPTAKGEDLPGGKPKKVEGAGGQAPKQEDKVTAAGTAKVEVEDKPKQPVKARPEPRPLTKAEQKEFQELSVKAKNAREQGGEPLTSEETQRYEYLTALAGQMELLGEDVASGIKARITQLKNKISEMDRLRIATQDRAYKSKFRREELLKEARTYAEQAARARAEIAKLERQLSGAGTAEEGGFELREMGGDIYAGEGEGEEMEEEDLASNMQAAIDRDRENMGLPAMGPTMRRTWGEDNDKALALMRKNESWIPNLIAEVTAKPRPLLSWENAGLVWHRARLRTMANAALDRMARAYDDGRKGDVKLERTNAMGIEDQIQALDEAVGRNGTSSEAGRTLQAQKMAAGPDYTLVEMRLRRRGVKGGAPLTEAEENNLRAEYEEMKRLHYEAVQNEAKVREQLVQSEIDKHKLSAELAARPKFDQRIVDFARRFVDRMDKAADQAADEIMKELGGRTFTGVDPAIAKLIPKVAVYAAGKILKHSWNLAELTADLSTRFKDAFKDHIQEIWDKAQEHIGAQTARVPRGVREKVKKVIEEESPEKKRKDIIESMKPKAEKKELDALYFDVQKLVRSIIDENRDISARELVDTVHNLLSEALPDLDLDRGETADLISGRGRFTPLAKDEVSVIKRDLKAQIRLTSHIQAVMSREIDPIPKSGVERPEVTDIQRHLTKQLNEAKRRFGVQVSDPSTQLKSALDARKTYYRNQISDLQHQIETRQKIVKQRTPPPTDVELQELIKQRDELKKDFDAIFGKPGLTDAQRLQIAMTGVQKSIAEYQRMLDAKQTRRDPKVSKVPKSAELDALRAHRDALEEEWQHLRDLDGALQAELHTKNLQKEIAELERRYKAGEFETPKTPATPKATTPELEALRAARKNLRRSLREAALNSDKARAEALRKAEAHGKELERRINEGDIARRAAPGRPVPPELAAQRAENAQLQGVIAKLRRAIEHPPRDPRDIALSAYKARAQRRIAELEDKLLNQNFTRTRREPLKLDAEGFRLRAAEKKLRQRFENEQRKFELKGRPFPEKVLDWFTTWRRFGVLSSPGVILKLMSAGLMRMTVAPLEDLAGVGLRIIPGVSGVARQARLEGHGFSLRDEMQAASDAWRQFSKKSWEFLKTGKTDIDALYGSQKASYTGELEPGGLIWALPGRVHGMIKAPVEVAAYHKAFRRLSTWYASQGVPELNPALPEVRTRIEVEAYKAARRSIFLNDNRAANAINNFISTFERLDKATRAVDLGGKVAATGARLLMPIMRVPTNVVAETFNYALGLPTGLARVGWHSAAGRALRAAMGESVKDLTPEQADSIMRQLKKGSIGGAMLAWGYWNADNIGGYYQRGQRREEEDVKYGNIRVGNVEIPSLLLHNPLLETAQLGATVRRVAESYLRATDPEEQGLVAGMLAAAWGLTEEVPFVREMLEMDKAANPFQRQKTAGEFVKSFAVPLLSQKIAEWIDPSPHWPWEEGTQRAPETIGEHVATGIPFLRKTVEEK